MNTEIQEIISTIERACEQFNPWGGFSATERLNNGSTTNPASSVIFRTNILTKTGALVEVRAEHSAGGEIYVIGTHSGDTFLFESYTIAALNKNFYADLRSAVERKIDAPSNEISILYSMVRDLIRNVEQLENKVSQLSERVNDVE